MIIYFCFVDFVHREFFFFWINNKNLVDLRESLDIKTNEKNDGDRKQKKKLNEKSPHSHESLINWYINTYNKNNQPNQFPMHQQQHTKINTYVESNEILLSFKIKIVCCCMLFGYFFSFSIWACFSFQFWHSFLFDHSIPHTSLWMHKYPAFVGMR